MEKTIEEFLSALPEPYRSKALEERQKAGSYWKGNKTANSLPGALSRAFDWQASNDGHDYWRDIKRRVESGELGTMPDEQPASAQLSIADHLKSIEGHIDAIRKAMESC